MFERKRKGRGRIRASLLLGGVALFSVHCARLEASFESTMRTYEGARLYQAGTKALNAGDFAQAIADLERASTLAPEASEIQNHLGLAYWAGGDNSRAESAFQRSLELDCENTAAQQNLASFEAANADASAPIDLAP